jgi:hypothetical protein
MVKKKTRRKGKKNIETVTLLSKFKEFTKLKYSNYKKSFSKFYKSFIEKYKDKLSSLKQFLLIIIGYGLIINLPLTFLLGFRFTFFTMISWGIVYYFINDEFVGFIRRLIAKR